MGQFFMQRLDKLLVMPPAERNAELDKWIDRMETMRKSMKAGGDQGGWRNRFADMSEAERDQRRKQRLDRSSPDMRAKFDRLWDLLNDPPDRARHGAVRYVWRTLASNGLAIGRSAPVRLQKSTAESYLTENLFKGWQRPFEQPVCTDGSLECYLLAQLTRPGSKTTRKPVPAR